MSQSIFFDVVARDRASNTFSRIARSSEATEARLKKFGRATAGAIGFTGLTAAAAGFIKVGSSYVGQLNKIQGLTGITDSRLERVSKTLESQSSSYAKLQQTTGDAAGGMVELIKAGQSVDSAMKSVNATMVLAKAGQLGVAESASLVSNTLNVFNLRATEAGRVANVLANAANVSSADVSDLRQALAMAGNVAAGAGASIEQTAAMLAELSNAGMQGSDAGTSLKTMLLSLQAPSSKATKNLKQLGVEVFDATGKMRPIGDVLDDTTKALAGLNDQQKAAKLKNIFGSDAFRAAKVIFGNGTAELNKYVAAVGKAGAAQRLAQANSKGLAGTMGQLRAETISAAQAGYRELSPSLDRVAKKLVVFVRQMKDGTGAGGDLVDIIRDLATVAKGAVRIIDDLPGPVKKFGVEGLIALVAINKMSSMFSGLGGRIRPSIVSLQQFRAEMTYSATRMDAVSRAANATGGAIRSLAGAGGLMMLMKAQKETNESSKLLLNTLGGAAAGFALGGPVGMMIGGLAGSTLSLFQATKKGGDAAKVAAPKWQNYADTLIGVAGATTKATRARIVDNLATSENRKLVAGLGLDQRVLVNAMMGQPRAMALVNQRQRQQLANADAAVAKQLKYIRDHKAGNQLEFRKLNTLRDQRSLLEDQIGAQDKLIGGVQKDAKEQRRKNALLLTQQQMLKMGIPKAAAHFIDTHGIKQDTTAVAQLIEKFKIVKGTQWKAVLTAAGIPPTKAAISQVQTKLDAIKRGAIARLDVNDHATPKLKGILAILHDLAGKTYMFGINTKSPPGRATGGPVRAGQPYIVGERRAELFVPNSSGRIVPQVPTGVGGGAGETVVEIHLHLDGETIVKTVRARNRRKGVATAGI